VTETPEEAKTRKMKQRYADMYLAMTLIPKEFFSENGQLNETAVTQRDTQTAAPVEGRDEQMGESTE
jgi:hypothetical protein